MRNYDTSRKLIIIFFAFFSSFFSLISASEALLEDKQKILILGDSITYQGTYVTNFEAWLVKKFPQRRYTVINAGLSSETVSGLSEEGHAGGKFLRPSLFERLERVLVKTKPDLIIACYGMNCGIYLELEESRSARYRNGILRLRAAAKQYGAEIVHMTPPIFDNHGKPGFDYDDILMAYSQWLVDQRKNGWNVVDLHSEMRVKVDRKKKKDPQFTTQKDKIHPDARGHWIMAQCLIKYFGGSGIEKLTSAREIISQPRLQAVGKRMHLYRNALHAETRPLRPVKQEGTLKSAKAGALELNDSIYQ